MKDRDREHQNIETIKLGIKSYCGNTTNYNPSPCQLNNQAPTNKIYLKP